MIAGVAARFDVGEASVVCWIKTPDVRTTRNKPLTKIDIEILAQDVKAASSFTHDMLRTHSYAPVGERYHGVKDWQARSRTNVIAALTEKTLLTVGLFTVNINADIFHARVT